MSIIDSNSCLLLDSFSINQPNLLTSQLTGVDLDCFGDVDGMIMSNVSGGVPPYSYLWLQVILPRICMEFLQEIMFFGFQ